MNRTYLLAFAVLPLATLLSCSTNKGTETAVSVFTRADSLTDHVLILEDSILNAWHLLVKNENAKLRNLENLVHELELTNPTSREELEGYMKQIQQLHRMRYNQRTIENTDVVDEFDFASRNLISEMIGLAQSLPEYSYNSTLQHLVAGIETLDKETPVLRGNYDKIVFAYNQFLESNHAELVELESGNSLTPKPVFQASLDE